MDDAEIERILRAIRTRLGIQPAGVAGRLRRGVDSGRLTAAERRGKARAVEHQEAGGVTRVNYAGWMPEAEARRLRKVIRTSFCNSPHKKKYWTALLDMYAGPDAGKTWPRHWRRPSLRHQKEAADERADGSINASLRMGVLRA